MGEENIIALSKKVEEKIQEQFKNVDNICQINSLKVIKAFQEANLSEMHLNSATGYGIDEPGRNKIEEIYAKEGERGSVFKFYSVRCNGLNS